MIRVELVYADGDVVYVDFAPGLRVSPTKSGLVSRVRLVGSAPQSHWIDIGGLSSFYLDPSMTLHVDPPTISFNGAGLRSMTWEEVSSHLNPGGVPIARAMPDVSGATCTKCREHNEYAEPSTTYVCYRCRR